MENESRTSFIAGYVISKTQDFVLSTGGEKPTREWLKNVAEAASGIFPEWYKKQQNEKGIKGIKQSNKK